MTGESKAPLRCNTLWIGEALGPIERACMRSVLRQGHPLTLYRYGELAGIPEGVEVRDAAEILPETAVIRYRGGSVALFANQFRYALQKLGKGLWIDIDLYLLKPLPGDRPYLFGRQDSWLINSAVMMTPADSPLLPPLLALFEECAVPPWLPILPRMRAHWRLLRTGKTGLADMPWGTAGPHALTAIARAQRLDHWAVPPAWFFPVRWQDAHWICDPGRRIENMIAPETIAIHLWNEVIKTVKSGPAAPGSFLARLHREGAWPNAATA